MSKEHACHIWRTYINQKGQYPYHGDFCDGCAWEFDLKDIAFYERLLKDWPRDYCLAISPGYTKWRDNHPNEVQAALKQVSIP